MYTFASRAAACVRAACASERRPHAAKTFPASRPVERERAYFVSSTPVDGTTRRSRSSCLAGIDECQIDAIQRSPRFNKLRTCGVRWYTWERGNVDGCRCLFTFTQFIRLCCWGIFYACVSIRNDSELCWVFFYFIAVKRSAEWKAF